MKTVTLKQKSYIFPNIRPYESFKDLLQGIKEQRISLLLSAQNNLSFEDLLSKKRGLVLTDPGYGKTRLFKELQTYASQNGKDVFSIDLKSYSGEKPIEKFIEKQIQINEDVAYKVEDKANVVFCFDALDEARQDMLSELTNELKLFLRRYANVSVFISCRLPFYEKFPLFEEESLAYITIERFNFQQVRDYLKEVVDKDEKRFFKKNDINRIIQDFREPNWDSIILIPRYLEKFFEFRYRHPHDKPTKSDLYNFFVNGRLQIEDDKRGAQDDALIRRLLEKIALVMEVYQRNEIAKDELITILEDIQSNIAGNFLEMGKLQILFDHGLWIDSGDTVSFEDHSLQEYLASCELFRLGSQRRIYDFAVDKDLREIHQSWFSTLSFVIDQDVSLLEPMLDFGIKRSEKVVEDEEYLRFLTKVDTSNIDKEQRTRIFKKVFSYYQNELLWIDRDIARRLATFFDSSVGDFLKKWIDEEELRDAGETEKFVKKGNVAFIVEFLLEQDKLDNIERDFWKEKLISFANDENENGVLQRHSLSALEQFEDDSLIKSVQKVFTHPDSSVKRVFLMFCRETNPNHDLSLKYFIEGMKCGEHVEARYGFFEITKKKFVKKFLDYLYEDEQFLKAFVDHEGIFEDKDQKIIQNIGAVFDDEVEEKLVEIVFKLIAIYEQESKFLKNIAILLREKDKGIIGKIFNKIKEGVKLQKYVMSYAELFVNLLSKDSVDDFVKGILDFENGKGKWLALRVFENAKWQRGKEGGEIYKQGRKYFKEDYKEIKKQQKKAKGKPEKGWVAYSRIKADLGLLPLLPDKKHWSIYLRALEQLEGSWNEVESYLTDYEKQKIKKFVEYELQSTDTQNLRFEVREWNEKGGIKTFSFSCSVAIFEKCLAVAKYFEVEIDKTSRQHVIDFIPYAWSKSLENIFGLIPDIKEEELIYVLEVYNSGSVLKYYLTSSFIRLIKEYQFKVAAPILKSFIDDDKISEYERKEALKVSEQLKPDSILLKTIFEKYKEEFTELSELASELLIENHKDADAIDWRLEELKKRKFTHIEPKEAHWVGAGEAELHRKEFAASLMKLQDSKYLDRFIELLGFSLDLLEKDKNYWPYTVYLWQVVIKYVGNLKLEQRSKSYEPVEKLEKFVQENMSKEGINWFKNNLAEIKRSYQIYFGPPKNINDCVRQYNALKAEQYLDIVTSNDLFEKIKESIADLRNWIEKEGAYKLFLNSKGEYRPEPDIQKLIELHLKSYLKSLGIDIILREPQLLSDERVDFFISYGFSPSMKVLIEVKLSKHSDLGPRMDMTEKTSYKKLQNYMEGFGADKGIFLIFNVDKEAAKWQKLLQKIEGVYTQINNVEVVGIDACNR
ncbi:hypothetical protein [Candidatus Oleimmundimicrobium sp.]|uniref:NACHT domain-containing protein n=1 Tax=Candidatus Oleimmundimicrobium sp. TaxID=3060597 RepID=UPI00271564CF|nr:hypothetical protein [Candidatus Oleimmundimicrobium sp.]MDO8886072.1 hypothetical protein [Candidatus Oleimmundimicrobium sp.]